MKQYYQLTEFLLKLMKVQIEKFTGLANIGVGPDAGINGFLVVDEVNELIQFTKTLIDLINRNVKSDEIFKSILGQTQFYLDQERLRGYAGWLMDENNVHATEYKRITQQYEADIQGIIPEDEIKDIPEPKPTNETQRQCQHDSYSIAYKITNLVVELMKNPEMELSDNLVPAHAREILRRHVSSDGRFSKPDIYDEIVRLHQKCNQFLIQSTLQTSTQPLSKEEAFKIRLNQERQFNQLLSQYQKCIPDSVLFSDKPGWFDIAICKKIIPQVGKKNVSTGILSHGLFDKKTVMLLSFAAIAIAMLIYNLAWKSDQDTPSLLSK